MSYRAVVRHVRYWRGVVHRWSTVYQFTGTPSSTPSVADCQTVLLSDDAMCYGGTAAEGGTYECQFYDHATGGVPIATYVAFDWTSPAAWVKHRGTAWTSASGPMASPAETALLTEWRAGFSRTGKPINLRKWYHAVPESQAVAGAPDLVTADHASLLSHASGMVGMLDSIGLTLGSSTGRFAGSASVLSYYGNHQMPRGRRKKKVSASAAKKLISDGDLAALLGEFL